MRLIGAITGKNHVGEEGGNLARNQDQGEKEDGSEDVIVEDEVHGILIDHLQGALDQNCVEGRSEAGENAKNDTNPGELELAPDSSQEADADNGAGQDHLAGGPLLKVEVHEEDSEREDERPRDLVEGGIHILETERVERESNDVDSNHGGERPRHLPRHLRRLEQPKDTGNMKKHHSHKNYRQDKRDMDEVRGVGGWCPCKYWVTATSRFPHFSSIAHLNPPKSTLPVATILAGVKSSNVTVWVRGGCVGAWVCGEKSKEAR